MVLTKARNHRISDPRKICRGKTFLDYYQTEKMEINCGVATWRLKFNLLIVWLLLLLSLHLQLLLAHCSYQQFAKTVIGRNSPSIRDFCEGSPGIENINTKFVIYQ